jgi:hypothetical protein
VIGCAGNEFDADPLSPDPLSPTLARRAASLPSVAGRCAIDDFIPIDRETAMSEKPKPFTMTPEGTIRTQTAPDGSISASSDKPIAIDIEDIKSVGIENLVDVEAHEISRLFNSTSHFVKFFGGGEVRFAYNDAGELLEFKMHHVTITIENGERIVLKRGDENTGADT